MAPAPGQCLGKELNLRLANEYGGLAVGSSSQKMISWVLRCTFSEIKYNLHSVSTVSLQISGLKLEFYVLSFLIG